MALQLPPVDGVAIGFLVGPGVLPHIDGLRAAAERVGVPVINTWGAKGVFRWDSELHGGTAGLQARDFDLAGLGEVDVLLTSGLDSAEVTSEPWLGRAEVVTIEPRDLAILADRWPAPRTTPSRPRLYTELAAVIGPMYDDPTTPPGRIRALAQDLAPGAIVFAPPGQVGFWVARTWPTTDPGSVVVPSSTESGLTERLAARAALDGRRTTMITDHPVNLEGVDVVVWDGDLTVPAALLEVAGPIVAWEPSR